MLKSLDDKIKIFDDVNEKLAELKVKRLLCNSQKERRLLKEEIFKINQELESAGNKIIDYALDKDDD